MSLVERHLLARVVDGQLLKSVTRVILETKHVQDANKQARIASRFLRSGPNA